MREQNFENINPESSLAINISTNYYHLSFHPSLFLWACRLAQSFLSEGIAAEPCQVSQPSSPCSAPQVPGSCADPCANYSCLSCNCNVIVLPQYWINNVEILKVHHVSYFLLDVGAENCIFIAQFKGVIKVLLLRMTWADSPLDKTRKNNFLPSSAWKTQKVGTPEQALPSPHIVRENWTSCTRIKHSSHWHLHPKHIPRGRWKLSAPWQQQHGAKKQQTWIQHLPRGEGSPAPCSHEAAWTTRLRKSLREASSMAAGAPLQAGSPKWQSEMRAGKKQSAFSLLAAAGSCEEMEDQHNFKISPLGNVRKPQLYLQWFYLNDSGASSASDSEIHWNVV